MIQRLRRCLAAPLAVFPALVALPLLGQQSAGELFSPEAVRFFESEVRPVLLNNCASCHNDELRTSGLSVESREDILKGGNRGAAVSPGLPRESRLIRAVRRQDVLKMPPAAKLAPREIAALARWIEMGLPWPAHGGVAAEASQAAGHWSFQPIERPAKPPVSDPSWARNPIDRFILARLDEEGLKPSPSAEKATLIRRAYIDLIGLLPNADEVDEFLEDTSPDNEANARSVSRVPRNHARLSP